MEGYWELLVICFLLVKEAWKDSGSYLFLTSEGSMEGYWELLVICFLLVKEAWKDTGSYLLFVSY